MFCADCNAVVHKKITGHIRRLYIPVAQTSLNAVAEADEEDPQTEEYVAEVGTGWGSGLEVRVSASVVKLANLCRRMSGETFVRMFFYYVALATPSAIYDITWCGEGLRWT